jgi:hypothetical protein
MVFWAIVLGVVAVVLFLAWRRDRKHKVTIDRRNGAVESDIGRAAMYGGGTNLPPDMPSGS